MTNILGRDEASPDFLVEILFLPLGLRCPEEQEKLWLGF